MDNNQHNRRRIVVLGAGESGFGAAVLAKDKGMDVFLSDCGAIAPKYSKRLADEGIPFEEGHHSLDKILCADEIVKVRAFRSMRPSSRPLATKTFQ